MLWPWGWTHPALRTPKFKSKHLMQKSLNLDWSKADLDRHQRKTQLHKTGSKPMYMGGITKFRFEVKRFETAVKEWGIVFSLQIFERGKLTSSICAQSPQPNSKEHLTYYFLYKEQTQLSLTHTCEAPATIPFIDMFINSLSLKLDNWSVLLPQHLTCWLFVKIPPEKPNPYEIVENESDPGGKIKSLLPLHSAAIGWVCIIESGADLVVTNWEVLW